MGANWQDMPAGFHVRAVTRADLPAVGRLAAKLLRYHHALDPLRFISVTDPEQGYARFLGGEMDDPNAVVVCAVRGGSGEAGEIVGYAYGTLEGRDWNMLLDAHGALHDVLVDESARRSGVGAMLVLDVCRRLGEMGAPRVVLSTAVQNREGRALFGKLGFRETMVEMTREAEEPPKKTP
jgi:ribosomal protein S18 acetylase RimI-like enzyme